MKTVSKLFPKLPLISKLNIFILGMGIIICLLVYFLSCTIEESAQFGDLIAGTVGVALTFMSILIIAKTLSSQDNHYSMAHHYELVKHFKDIFEALLRFRDTNPMLKDHIDKLLFNYTDDTNSRQLKIILNSKIYDNTSIRNLVSSFENYTSRLKADYNLNYIWSQIKYLERLKVKLEEEKSDYIESIKAQLDLVKDDYSKFIDYYDFIFFNQSTRHTFNEYVSKMEIPTFPEITKEYTMYRFNFEEFQNTIIMSPENITLKKIELNGISSTIHFELAANSTVKFNQINLPEASWNSLRVLTSSPAITNMEDINIELTFNKTGEQIEWKVKL